MKIVSTNLRKEGKGIGNRLHCTQPLTELCNSREIAETQTNNIIIIYITAYR